jgi:hypothetical protein
MGLSDYHSSEQQPRQLDRGPVGQIKGILSRHIYLRKGELRSSSLLVYKRANGSLPKKSTTDKRKNAYCKLWGVVAEGRGDVDVDGDE